MIIKKRDSKQPEIDELTKLLSIPLPDNKKSLIERELRFIRSGDQGEKDAAYFINFHFGLSKRWTVIHDLRLEYQDRVAQIDHLLINRFFDIYILESKNFSYGLKITDTGEFLVNNGKSYCSIESPIEQNKRHQIVLEQIIKKYEVMPKRLRIMLTPSFYCYVLVSPKSRVVRPDRSRFDTSMVLKTDTLRTAIDKRVDKMNSILVITTASKISSFKAVIEVAKRLAALHKPLKTDYKKRFGIKDRGLPQIGTKKSVDIQSSKQFYCFKCKKAIVEQVAKFCWNNNRRFHGKAYCFDCQKAFSRPR